VEQDPQMLINYLETLTNNEMEKIEAIFCWIAQNISYDFEVINNPGTYIETDAYSVLYNRQTVCQGFSELFKLLCNTAGIECRVIYGWVKVRGFSIKSGDGTNHAWNMVKLNDEWKLVDVTFGSGYGYFEDGQWVFKRSFIPQYLFIEPEKLIKTHLPVFPEWQMLEDPVTKDEFFALDSY
jgi:transglutaminase/protease-like cytokinesis protein 3